ncbi:MAG TPA: peptidoglycan-binding domain-containing protein [Chthoniobacteraceae bacterium]
MGGRSVVNTNRTFNRSAVRVPDSICHAWDRGHEHLWNNHRCRFYDGAWYAYDGDYPNDYGDNGSENPNASEVVDNPDVAAAPAPVESAPVVSHSPYATVQDVQDALANAGYYHGEIDGNLSPQLRYAVTAFQRDHHLNVTGSLDIETLSALASK